MTRHMARISVIVLLSGLFFLEGLIVSCSLAPDRSNRRQTGQTLPNTEQNASRGKVVPGSRITGTSIDRGQQYYRSARKALEDEKDQEKYISLLEKSTDQFVKALELEPRDSRPHFFLAVIDAYRGDLTSALRGFNNARKLNPTGVSYTNIAEIFIYLGRLQKAYKWNDLGLRKGAPYGAYVFNEMLLAWKEGDLKDAESNFFTLKKNNPEYISIINVSELSEPPENFEGFAQYCCSSPACGPYMIEACTELSLTVQQRKLSQEAILKDLKIEIERTRRLRKIYDQRRELEITIEAPKSP